VGCILRPRTWKRIRWPDASRASHIARKRGESVQSWVWLGSTENGLHGVGVRNEAKNRDGNSANRVFDEAQHVSKPGRGVMWHEGAGKEFRDGAGGLEWNDFVPLAVFDQIDAVERTGGLHGNSGIPMPGRSVHEDAAGAFAQDDAVIAEDANARPPEPKAGSGAFSRAGMTDEQAPEAIASENAATMDFHAGSRGEAMDHEKFVEGILERINGTRGVEATLEQEDSPATKGAVKAGFLIRSAAEVSGLKIERETVIFDVSAPEAARLEGWRNRRKFKTIGPGNVDFDVAGWVAGGEWQEARLQSQFHVTVGADAEGDAGDGEGDAACSNAAGSGVCRLERRVVLSGVHVTALLHDPMELQATTDTQEPETGPPEPTILQLPRTASSGRRLTATT